MSHNAFAQVFLMHLNTNYHGKESGRNMRYLAIAFEEEMQHAIDMMIATKMEFLLSEVSLIVGNPPSGHRDSKIDPARPDIRHIKSAQLLNTQMSAATNGKHHITKST